MHKIKCEMCGLKKARTIHHLVPKNVAWKYGFVGTVAICTECHKYVHKYFSNEELATLYNNSDLLVNASVDPVSMILKHNPKAPSNS